MSALWLLIGAIVGGAVAWWLKGRRIGADARELRTQLDAKQAEGAQITGDLERAQTDAASHEAALTLTEEKIKDLEARLTRADEAKTLFASKLEASEQTSRDIETQLLAARRDRSAFSERLAGVQKRLVQTERREASLEREIHTLQEELVGERARTGDLADESASHLGHIETLTEKVNAISKIERQRDGAMATALEYEAQNNRLKRVQNEVRAQVAELEARRSLLETELERLRSDLAASEASQLNTADLARSLSEQIEAKDLAIGEVERGIEAVRLEKDQEIGLLQGAVATMVSRDEIRELHDEIEKREERITELEQEMALLVDGEVLGGLAAKLEERDRQIEDLQGRLEAKAGARAASTGQLEVVPVAGFAETAWTDDSGNLPRDDLKAIKGIGPKFERMLNELGVFQYRQVGRLDADDINRLAQALRSFPDRILRDQWVEQARALHESKYADGSHWSSESEVAALSKLH